MGDIPLYAYLASCPIAFCRLTALLAWYFAGEFSYGNRIKPPSGDEWVFAGLASLLGCWLWPVLAIMYVGRRVLLPPPKHVQAKLQQQRIEELERELGIK